MIVVDDHGGFRSSVVEALSLVPHVEVAGEADNGERAREIVIALEPDVVIIDASMADMGGVEAPRQIRKLNPATNVVMMTSFDNPTAELAAMAAGASDVVTKGSPLEEIVGVILNAAGPRPSQPIGRIDQAQTTLPLPSPNGEGHSDG